MLPINTTLNNHAPIKIKPKTNATLIDKPWITHATMQLENPLQLKKGSKKNSFIEKMINAKRKQSLSTLKLTDYLCNQNKNSFYPCPTCKEDTEDITSTIRTDKTCEPNNIPTRILKDFKKELSKRLGDVRLRSQICSVSVILA